MASMKKTDIDAFWPTLAFGYSTTEDESTEKTSGFEESFTESIEVGFEHTSKAGFGTSTSSTVSGSIGFEATQTQSKTVANAVAASVTQSSDLTCTLACTVPGGEATAGQGNSLPIGSICPDGYDDDPNIYIWFWEMSMFRPWDEGQSVNIATCFTQCTCSSAPPSCMLTECADEFCTICKDEYVWSSDIVVSGEIDLTITDMADDYLQVLSERISSQFGLQSSQVLLQVVTSSHRRQLSHGGGRISFQLHGLRNPKTATTVVEFFQRPDLSAALGMGTISRAVNVKQTMQAVEGPSPPPPNLESETADSYRYGVETGVAIALGCVATCLALVALAGVSGMVFKLQGAHGCLGYQLVRQQAPAELSAKAPAAKDTVTMTTIEIEQVSNTAM